MPPQIVTLGEDELKRNIKRLSDSIATEGLEKSVLAGGFIVVTDAKLHAPVDTGFHRNSIRADVTQSTRQRVTVDVSFGSDYGIYLELGTVKMSARPHLRPALENNVSEIQNAAAVTLVNYIVRAIGAT